MLWLVEPLQGNDREISRARVPEPSLSNGFSNQDVSMQTTEQQQEERYFLCGPNRDVLTDTRL
jgi:hypothetical protein